MPPAHPSRQYGRGAITVNNYLAFIKKGHEKLRASGITQQQVRHRGKDLP